MLFELVRLFVLVLYHPHFLLSTHVIEFKRCPENYLAFVIIRSDLVA